MRSPRREINRSMGNQRYTRTWNPDELQRSNYLRGIERTAVERPPANCENDRRRRGDFDGRDNSRGITHRHFDHAGIRARRARRDARVVDSRRGAGNAVSRGPGERSRNQAVGGRVRRLRNSSTRFAVRKFRDGELTSTYHAGWRVLRGGRASGRNTKRRSQRTASTFFTIDSRAARRLFRLSSQRRGQPGFGASRRRELAPEPRHAARRRWPDRARVRRRTRRHRPVTARGRCSSLTRDLSRFVF